MNRVGNTNWLSNRQVTHRVATQALPTLRVREFTTDLLPLTVRSIGVVPSWIFLAMIILATVAICSTVIVRTRAELGNSASRHDLVAAEIDSMRRSNALIALEIHRMTNDPRAIEAAARDRLGMVRPTDIVVPIDALQSSTKLHTLGFVR